ncbi:MAG: Ig-like domain-containing protein, partial [Bacteroidales bacterium]|nr:Ig-like domain-containing protein [Bacteroidales bacterium]
DVTGINMPAGEVTALKEGETTITAKAGDKSATCKIIVKKKADDGGGNGGGNDKAVESIAVDPAVTKITIGADGILTAIITPSDAKADIKWVSDNTQVVTVEKTSDRQAKITGVSVGTTKVLAIVGDKMAFSEVTVERDGGSGGGGGSSTINSASVDPSFVALGLDQEQVVSLVMDPEDAEVTIYWESQASYVAKVQMISKTQAKITGVGVGQTVVTVHAGDLTANCQVSVTDSDNSVPVESVTLDKHELTLSVNQQYQFTATVLPENASNKNVVWASSANSAKLYISSTGQLTALQPCEATITVRCQANPMIYDTCQVTVTGGSSDPGEEVVDLGLPSGLKWRSMNVGASKPEDYGDYFAWGETSPKASYTNSNYKYRSSDIYGDGIGKKGTVLIPEDDAATVNVGSDWRTPKFSEWKELKEKCTWTWTTRNGVKGMQVTGPSGKSIFLPAGGCYGSSVTYRGTQGHYWSASYGSDIWAEDVEFMSTDVNYGLVDRCIGRSIRPVKD